MTVKLRKVKISDKKHFSKWWRDKNLIKLTSGNPEKISDKKLEKYFKTMLGSKTDHDFMILTDEKVIGHLALRKRRLGWYETQIVIGNKKCWGKGFGTKAIKLLLNKAKRFGIFKIYLEVRPNNTRAIKAYEKCGFKPVGIKKYPKNKYLPQTLKMALY